MSMNMPLSHDQFAVKKVRSDEFMSPAELISGPCALPEVPLAMPRQELEREHSIGRRLITALRLQARRLPLGSPERSV